MARIPPNAINVLLELGIQLLKAVKDLNENGKLLAPEKPKEEKGDKDDKKQDVQSAPVKKNYVKAVSKGLYKIFSKMGISTLQSYCGAQIYEAVGLDTEIVANYFTGTPTNIEGLSLEMLEEETAWLKNKGWLQ